MAAGALLALREGPHKGYISGLYQRILRLSRARCCWRPFDKSLVRAIAPYRQANRRDLLVRAVLDGFGELR